jgi:MoxR-like ATPase
MSVCLSAAQVHEYDCLLLEYVFGNRPDDSQKVRAYVLDTIASDPGLQQTELLFLGLFGRACRVLEDADKAVSASPQSP